MAVHLETDRDVAVLRLEQGKVNALDRELLAAIAQRLEELRSDGSVAVVLTGTGKSFSAGVDLYRVLDGGVAYVEEFLPLLGRVVRVLLAFPRPVIAAVNGHAVAGGLVLAAACDYRLMAEGGAKVGLTELPVGVPFPWVALETVRRLVGDRTARRLIYGGALYSANEALEMGLVDELAPPERLTQRALELASERGSIAPGAFRLTKAQLNSPILDARQGEVAAHDAEVLEAWKSPASRDAVRGFLERTLGRR